MKKRWLLVFVVSFFAFCFSVSADPSSLGPESAGTYDVSNPTSVYYSNITFEQYGLRLTIVNENGEKISENTVDYWENGTPPSGTQMLKGSNFKTKIVNDKTLEYQMVGYSGFVQGNPVNIDGAYRGDDGINWETKHVQLEEKIAEVKPGEKCLNPTFLDELGYDLCKALEDDCNALEKTYLLIEPLMLTHAIESESTKKVFSGTEYSFYLKNYKAVKASGDPKYYSGEHVQGTMNYGEFVIRNQIGGSMWRDLANMRLSCFKKNEKTSGDDDCTWNLKSGGSKYAYVNSKITKNANNVNLGYHDGTILDKNKNVLGTSMQLVWFGRLAEKCENECVYDSENPTFMVECCDNGDYLDDYFAANGPGDFVTACCEDHIYLEKYSFLANKSTGALIKEYCEEEDTGNCIYKVGEPDFVLQVCDDDDDNNTSVFMDPLYANNFLTNAGLGIANKIVDIQTVPKSYGDNPYPITMNGFTAMAYSDDAKIYIDQNLSGTYCKTYCQEFLEITLPDNYPYVQAGRYFYWDVKNTDHHVIEVKGEKVCAHDIMLDDWFADYKKAAEACQEAGHALGSCYQTADELVGGPAGTSCVDKAFEAVKLCKEGPDYKKAQTNNEQLIDDAIENGEYEDERQEAFESGFDSKFGTGAYNGFKTNFEHHNGDQNIDINGPEAKKYFIEYKYGTEDDWNTINSGADQAQRNAATSGVTTNPKYEVDPCASLEEDLRQYQEYDSTYRGCIGIDDKGQRTTETLVVRINSLKSCFADIYPESDKEIKNYTVDLDVEYGYETLFNGKELFYTPDEIEKKSNFEDEEKTVELLDGLCFYNEISEDSGQMFNPCNPKTVFVTKNDICEPSDPIQYFPNCTNYKRNWDDNSEHYTTTLTYKGYNGVSVYTVPTYNVKNKSSFNPNYYSTNQCYTTGWSVETEDLSKYWKTIYVTREIIDDYYVLNEAINACVCKDGEILDLTTDGECECKKVTDYNVVEDEASAYTCYFEWESSTSYSIIDQEGGNFSVEFMNPTGFYPLYLSYGNIGFNGHFSQYLLNNFYPECPNGICNYSDETNACEFFVDNEIMNDGGNIEDNICPEGDCDLNDDDVCPDGDCPRPVDGGGGSDDNSINGMEVIYRVIDLDNPFPGSDANGLESSRTPGANWNSSDMDLVDKYITNNRGVEGNLLYSSGLEPLYSFTLTPASIKEIRRFNALNPDYASQGTMIFNDGTVTGGVSYVLRDTLKNMIVSPTGNEDYFIINLDDERFDDINNNDIISNDGMLNTCRDAFSGVSE